MKPWHLVVLAGVALALFAARALARRVGRGFVDGYRDTSWTRAGDAALAARRHSRRVGAWTLWAGVAGLLVGPYLAAGLRAVLPSTAAAAGVAAVPLAVGLATVGAAAAGELTWPAPAGTVRSAPLARRTVHDVAPRRLLVWTGAVVLVLVAAAGLGAATAVPGQDTLERSAGDGAATASPYAGVPLAVALVVACLAVAGTAAWTLVLVVRRPAVTGVDDAWDLALRRRSAARVLRATQLVVGLTAAAVLAVDGAAVIGVGLQAAGRAHGVAGMVLLVACVAVATARTPALPGPASPAERVGRAERASGAAR